MHPNLDMIGETPNPDDEETFRNMAHPSTSPQSKLLQSHGQAPEPFNLSGDNSPPNGPQRLLSQNDFVASSRKFEGKSSRRGHEIQIPNYTREPRHFTRMQKAI